MQHILRYVKLLLLVVFPLVVSELRGSSRRGREKGPARAVKKSSENVPDRSLAATRDTRTDDIGVHWGEPQVWQAFSSRMEEEESRLLRPADSSTATHDMSGLARLEHMLTITVDPSPSPNPAPNQSSADDDILHRIKSPPTQAAHPNGSTKTHQSKNEDSPSSLKGGLTEAAYRPTASPAVSSTLLDTIKGVSGGMGVPATEPDSKNNAVSTPHPSEPINSGVMKTLKARYNSGPTVSDASILSTVKGISQPPPPTTSPLFSSSQSSEQVLASPVAVTTMTPSAPVDSPNIADPSKEVPSNDTSSESSSGPSVSPSASTRSAEPSMVPTLSFSPRLRETTLAPSLSPTKDTDAPTSDSPKAIDQVTSNYPSSEPSSGPSVSTSATGSAETSMVPTEAPSIMLSSSPSARQSSVPSQGPTSIPTPRSSSTMATEAPITDSPAVPDPSYDVPSNGPTSAPSSGLSLSPSATGSAEPSMVPTEAPSIMLSSTPGLRQIAIPSFVPSKATPSSSPRIPTDTPRMDRPAKVFGPAEPSSSPNSATSVNENATVEPSSWVLHKLSSASSTLPSYVPTTVSDAPTLDIVHISDQTTAPLNAGSALSSSPIVSSSLAGGTGSSYSPTKVPSDIPSTLPSGRRNNMPSYLREIPSTVPSVSISAALTHSPVALPLAPPSNSSVRTQQAQNIFNRLVEDIKLSAEEAAVDQASHNVMKRGMSSKNGKGNNKSGVSPTAAVSKQAGPSVSPLSNVSSSRAKKTAGKDKKKSSKQSPPSLAPLSPGRPSPLPSSSSPIQPTTALPTLLSAPQNILSRSSSKKGMGKGKKGRSGSSRSSSSLSSSSKTVGEFPTATPTTQPFSSPTREPAMISSPSRLPTTQPTAQPTQRTTNSPFEAMVGPTQQPSLASSEIPSDVPSIRPSADISSDTPSDVPSTDILSDTPSDVKSGVPSDFLSDVPSNISSDAPSTTPSIELSTAMPTISMAPSTSTSPSTVPSDMPSNPPSSSPTISISPSISVSPSTATGVPSVAPSVSVVPSVSPSSSPTLSLSPSISVSPTTSTDSPSRAPSVLPSGEPTLGPTLSPTVTRVQRTTIPRYYIAYVAPNANREPTDAEYERIRSNTNTYFTRYLRDIYEAMTPPTVTLLRMESEVNNTRYELGVPQPRYNIYMDFVMETTYSFESVVPTPSEQFDLLKEAINPSYIIEEVRTLTGTPFASVNEAFFAAAVEFDR